MLLLEELYGLKNVKKVKNEETYFDFDNDKIYTATFLMSGKGATVTVEKIIPTYIDENENVTYESILQECRGIAF